MIRMLWHTFGQGWKFDYWKRDCERDWLLFPPTYSDHGAPIDNCILLTSQPQFESDETCYRIQQQ